jgi:formylglycine-generating enzyme required for sulfatase activity
MRVRETALLVILICFLSSIVGCGQSGGDHLYSVGEIELGMKMSTFFKLAEDDDGKVNWDIIRGEPKDKINGNTSLRFGVGYDGKLKKLHGKFVKTIDVKYRDGRLVEASIRIAGGGAFDKIGAEFESRYGAGKTSDKSKSWNSGQASAEVTKYGFLPSETTTTVTLVHRGPFKVQPDNSGGDNSNPSQTENKKAAAKPKPAKDKEAMIDAKMVADARFRAYITAADKKAADKAAKDKAAKDKAAKGKAAMEKAAMEKAAMEKEAKALAEEKRNAEAWKSFAKLSPSEILKKAPFKNSIGMDFKVIPSGAFRMGARVTAQDLKQVDWFCFGVFEVTQSQYAKVMGKNPSKFSGANHPVETVNWNDATEFCRRLSNMPAETMLGRTYRLPTEAEWEYACKSGTETKHSFEGTLDEYAWYDMNSSNKTHPVGQKKPNRWGLYDMYGNVFEFCQDFLDPRAISSRKRVVRGGSWGSIKECTSTFRHGDTPSFSYEFNGFRVVLEISEPSQLAFLLTNSAEESGLEAKTKADKDKAAPVAYWLKRGDDISGPLDRMAIVRASDGNYLKIGDQIANAKDGPWQDITKEQLQQMQQGSDVEIK